MADPQGTKQVVGVTNPVRLPKLLYVAPLVVTPALLLVALIVQDGPWETLALVGLLVSIVTQLVMVYRMWQSIQRGGTARMGPAKALGLMFVPIFNVYWTYQVYWGFAKDYNALAETLNARTQDDGKKLESLPTGRFLTLGVLDSIGAVILLFTRTAPATALSGVKQDLNQAGTAEALTWGLAVFATVLQGCWIAVTDSVCNVVNGLADCETVEGGRSDERVEQLFGEGCRLADSGEHTAAIEAFSKCTKVDPTHADAWHNMGCSLLELGRVDDAVSSFAQALALRPNDSATCFARGLAREKSGDPVGAAEDFTRYLGCCEDLDSDKADYAREAIGDNRSRPSPNTASAPMPGDPEPRPQPNPEFDGPRTEARSKRSVKLEERLEKPERTANHAPHRGVNLSFIQKLAVSATLLAVAVFLFAGGCQVDMWQVGGNEVVRSASRPEYGAHVGRCMDLGRTMAVFSGILLVGGVATFLLGLMPARRSGTPGDAGRLPPGR